MNTNFYNFLINLYSLNQSLFDSEGIHLYFSDIPFSWEDMTASKYDSVRKNILPQRDRIMADQIASKFKDIIASDQPRKKCLVIMNFRHAFGPIKNPAGILLDNTGGLLFDQFQEKVANVLINTIGTFLDRKWLKLQIPGCFHGNRIF